MNRLVLILLVVALSAAGCNGSKPSRPDVILVSIDTLRFDHLGCYGYPAPTSPVIDRLAAGGARFETVVSTTSWTLPAHAALFTGLYDSTHGATDNDRRLGEENVTLAETLRDAGYMTAGFYGGPFLHPTFGLDQGFDQYTSCMTRLPGNLPPEAISAQSSAPRAASHEDVTGPKTLREVSTWLDTLDERPFFLFVHLWDVHYDYLAPRKYVDLFDPGYDGPITGVDFMHDPAINAGMDAADFRHLLALYDAEIRFTDEILGMILDAVGNHERADAPLIIVTADHGEEFFEHGLKGHSQTLFDEVIRVPLIFSWQGHLPEGEVIDRQVRLIDIMPTILGLAGIEVGRPVQGRDLSDLLAGNDLPPEPALTELFVDGRRLRSLRSQQVKVFDSGYGDPPWGYDLVDDPGEQKPLTGNRPSIARNLDSLARETASALRLRKELGVLSPAIELDEEMLERLRSLGYIGDE